MVKAVFYIPEHFNDNRPVPEEHFLELHEFLRREFGGYTLAGRVEGAWTDPDTGAVIQDISFKYEIALKRDKISVLKSYLIEFKKKIEQAAIYFEIDSDVQIELL